ncbi:MAG: hypothetical protein NZ911_05240 [Sulfolobales archaeon]|nr:hypothetical protein [Sulfolobales archaeon]
MLLSMTFLVVLMIYSLFPNGFLTSRFINIYSREVVGFEVCKHQIDMSNFNCTLLMGDHEIKKVCSGLVCVSRFIYDDYSEPPDLIFGVKYFEGVVIYSIDLIRNNIRRVVTINLTRNNVIQTLSIEKNLGDFTHKKLCIADFFEGIINPSIRYVSDGVIRLNITLLTYEVINCSVHGCLYYYRQSFNESLLSKYEKAFDVWTSIMRSLLGYNSIVKFINGSRNGFTVFIPYREGGIVEFNELHSIWNLLNEFIDDNSIIIIEVPGPIKLGSDTLLAFTYRNLMFVGNRRVDVIVHEVGHVLGLQHPKVFNIEGFWVDDIFYESIMLKTSPSNCKRVSLGDLVGLARSIYVLEDFDGREELIRNLSSLGIDADNICTIIPVAKRIYPSKDIPEVISSIIREGIARLDFSDDGDLVDYDLNYNTLKLLKIFSERYRVNY